MLYGDLFLLDVVLFNFTIWRSIEQQFGTIATFSHDYFEKQGFFLVTSLDKHM